MPRCARALLAVLPLALFLAAAAPAGAAITEGQITVPADPTNLLTTDPDAEIHVEGTTDGVAPDEAEIRCFYSDGDQLYPAQGGFPAAVDAMGDFSVDLPVKPFFGTCRLLVVGDDWDFGEPPPAGSTGPVVTFGARFLDRLVGGPNDNKAVDYVINQQQPSMYTDYLSVGACGFCDMFLNQPGTFGNSAVIFYGNGALYYGDPGNGLPYARIGGHNAYASASAASINDAASGLPAVQLTTSFDSVTGDVHIQESSPFVRCETDVLEPQTSDCPTFIDTGVRLDRDMRSFDSERLVKMVDDWVNTTGQPQRLQIQYDQDSFEPLFATGSFQFPWVSPGYEVQTGGNTFAGPPAGPASMFFKTKSDAPDGSFDYPQGAITFQPAPTSFYVYDASDFLTSYDLEIPAGGSMRIVQHFRGAPDLATLKAGAQRSEDELRPPPIAAAQPAQDSQAPDVQGFAIADRSFAVSGESTPVTARAKRGTKFRYALSEPAKVTIDIQRAVAGIKVRKRVGRRTRNTCVTKSRRNLKTLTRQLSARSNVKRLSGRAKKRALARLVKRARCNLFRGAGTLTRNNGAGANETKFSGRIGSRALQVGSYRALLVARDAAGNASAQKAVSFKIVKR